MSPLWEKKKTNTTYKIKKGVCVDKSLKSKRIRSDFARNLIPHVFGRIFQRNPIQKESKCQNGFSVKGTSLRISAKVLASMTVEASLVLPLFLLFFLQVGGIMEIMRLHGRVEMALWQTGRETCLYAAALRAGKQASAAPDNAASREILGKVGNFTLSYAYVKGRVERFAGWEYLESAPLKGGKNGLQYLGSEVLREDEQVQFTVTYMVDAKWRVNVFHPPWLQNRYVGRLWTGYALTENTGRIYYLAENMSVYHVDRECTHLRLRMEKIPRKMLSAKRNQNGSRYRPCAKCVTKDCPDEIWISPEGDCYHARKDCAGLKRTVREVFWEEASHFRPCARCGKKEAGESW